MNGKRFWSIISYTLWGILLIGMLFRTLSSCSMPTLDSYVYVTPYGEKYHYNECFYIDDAAYLTKYDNYLEAENHGYDSCSRCNSNNYTLWTKIDIKLDNK